MIRGRLIGAPGRLRRFVTAKLAIPSQVVSGDVTFLVDTGADGTLLAPSDAAMLGINTAEFPLGPPSTGVGGTTPTVYARATITVDEHTYDVDLCILTPRTQSQRIALARIPSLLGRDILSHFALFFEERTNRVLLLTPEEADALNLP